MKNFEHIRPSATAMNNLNIQTLKNYPNRQSPIGNNLSAEELKKRFDAQSEYLRDKISELVNTLQAVDITERIKTGAEQTLKDKLAILTETFDDYKTTLDLAKIDGASFIGADKDGELSNVQTLMDVIYTKTGNLETKVGNENIASVATDISKAILALKALIDNVYTKSQTYSKTEIHTQQTAQDNRLISLETKQGADDITAIASNISKAILSLNEDIDSLQLGVVPRVLRGIVEANTYVGALTPELIALLNAKVLEMTGRGTPNNTDAVQILDTGDIDKDLMYTYYYWTSGAGTSEFDGWYLAYSALSQFIENEPSYTLNFTAMLWELGEDNLYHTIRTAEQHGIGGDNTINVDLLKLVDGNYEPISTFTVGSTGTVDVYTDEVFEGTLCIRTGKAYRVPTLNIVQNQVIGLEEDLIEIRDDIIANKGYVDKITKNIKTNARVSFDENRFFKKTWTGLTNFSGNEIWTDGTNIYRSYGSSHYVLDVSTSDWSIKTWTGLTDFYGYDIWTDGTNIYWSYGSLHYVLDVAASDWSIKTWTGLTNFDGQTIWTDGTNIYRSNASSQYVLDVATSDWSIKAWTGLTNFSGRYIWTDGTNIYYSSVSSQYVLNVATSTWSIKTWTGLTDFSGNEIWTDGTNIYRSYAGFHRVLNVSTSTWSIKSWTGLTSFNGNDIWTDGTNIHRSNTSSQYVLANRLSINMKN